MYLFLYNWSKHKAFSQKFETKTRSFRLKNFPDNVYKAKLLDSPREGRNTHFPEVDLRKRFSTGHRLTEWFNNQMASVSWSESAHLKALNVFNVVIAFHTDALPNWPNLQNRTSLKQNSESENFGSRVLWLMNVQSKININILLHVILV